MLELVQAVCTLTLWTFTMSTEATVATGLDPATPAQSVFAWEQQMCPARSGISFVITLQAAAPEAQGL